MRGRKPSVAKRAELDVIDVPDAPSWLQGDALDEWHRVVSDLVKRSLITAVDTMILAGYCQCYSEYRKASLQVEQDGQMLDDKLHPLARYAAQQLDQLRKMAAEFGFTPSARAKINLPPATKEQDDLDEFLNS